jgi:PIN domain
VPRQWREIDRAISSALIVTESLRTLDRLRLRARLSDSEAGPLRQTILSAVAALELIEIDPTILERAAQPMPTELGILDAIHLTSALFWREATGADITMATHDRALALGARAHGMKVLGVSFA